MVGYDDRLEDPGMVGTPADGEDSPLVLMTLTEELGGVSHILFVVGGLLSIVGGMVLVRHLLTREPRAKKEKDEDEDDEESTVRLLYW